MCKTVNTTTEQFTWNTESSLPLLLADGSTNFIYGPGNTPLEQVAANGAVYFYYHDELGSTRALSDTTGAIVATYSYDAYGNLTASTGTVYNPLQYAGQYTDSESGYLYLRARYYDPATEQFLARDPLVPLTKQPYGYTGGNPVNRVDLSGLVTVGWCYNIHSSLMWFPVGGFGQACLQTANGVQWGFSETLGGGAQTPSVGDGFGPQISNGNSICDLNGWFTYGGGSIGEGPYAGATGFVGQNSAGKTIFGGDFSAGGEVNPPFIPIEVHGGRSYTWTQTIFNF